MIADLTKNQASGGQPGRRAAPGGVSPPPPRIAATEALWPAPTSMIARPPWPREARQLAAQASVCIQPVGPAGKGQHRIEFCHLGRQAGYLASPNIGRVAENQVETLVEGTPPQSPRRKRARDDNPSDSALATATARAAGLRSMPSPRAFGSSLSSASNRQPLPVPRSSTESGLVRSTDSNLAAISVSLSGRGSRVSAPARSEGSRTRASRGSAKSARALPGGGRNRPVALFRRTQFAFRMGDHRGAGQPGGFGGQQPGFAPRSEMPAAARRPATSSIAQPRSVNRPPPGESPDPRRSGHR